jgi:hypothetical protein
LKPELKGRLNRFGMYLAVSYVLIVVVVFTITLISTKPSNVGLDWIPFIMLAMPWFAMGQAQEFLLPGLIANVVILYLLGTFFEMARRRIFRR